MKIKLSNDEYSKILANQQAQAQAQAQKVSTPATSTPQNQDLIGSILTGLTSPFRGLASQGVQLVTGVGDIIGQLGQGKSLQDALANTDISERANELGLLNAQEAEQAQKNPLAFGVGNAAQIGSLAIPAGAGIKGMAGMGLASGALAGGGQALASGQDVLTGTTTGGLMGGALGGGLGLLGKAVSGIKPTLSKVGDKTVKSAIDTGDLAFIREAGGGVKPKDLGIMRDWENMTGQKIMNTSVKTAKKINDELLAKNAPVLQNFIDKSVERGAVVDINKIVKTLEDLKLNKQYMPYKDQIDIVIKNIRDSSDRGLLGIAEANNLRSNIGQSMANAWTKMARTGEDLTPIHEALNKAYGGLRDAIDNGIIESKVADAATIKNVNNQVHEALKMNQYLETAANTAMPRSGVTGVDAIIYGSALTNPANLALVAGKKVLESAPGQRKIAQSLYKVGQGMQKAGEATISTGTTSRALPFLLGKDKRIAKNVLSGLVTNGIVNKPENASLGLPDNMKNKTYDTQKQTETPSYLSSTTPTQQTGLGFLKPQSSEFDTLGFLQQARAFGLTPQQAFTQMLSQKNKFETENKPSSLTATQRTNQAKLDSSIAGIDEAMSLVEQNADLMGPIAGSDFMGTLQNLGLTGEFGQRRAYLQTTLSALGQQIAKGLEGGRMTDQDRKFYQAEVVAALRQPADVALSKLQAIKDRIQQERDVTERQILGTPQMGDYTDYLQTP